ncbi:MAG TPA: class II aldolase/adducin family protein, partial [Dehalococcoidia bacterium]|nr:class II aldolase/adducin family protein [Dehalococcoidia bacterium]
MWDSEKRTVIEAAREIASKELVSGTAGNVSLRLRVSGGRELVAITPSGRHYDSL